MTETYANPTRANRIKMAAAVGGWTAAAFLFGKVWIPVAKRHIDAGDCTSLDWMLATGAMLSVLLLIPAIAYGRGAYLTARNRRSPFPGEWIPFRIRITTGPWSIFMAAFQGLFAAGLAFVIGCIWVFFFQVCGPTLSCGC